MVEIKSIGLSMEVYRDLLEVKHQFERETGEIHSYDKVVKKLISKNNGGER